MSRLMDQGAAGRRDVGHASPEQRREELARLRRRMAAMSGRPGQVAEPVVPNLTGTAHVASAAVIPASSAADPAAMAQPSPGSPADVLPLPEGVAELVPQQGIPRGSVIQCAGARSLVTAMIAAVTRAGGQVGLVGLPQIGLLAAAELGADLDRIAAVPVPGVDPVEVASVLLDGMDLVVMGLSGVRVPPGRMRVIAGRARVQSSSLLVVGGQWPSARMSFDAQVLDHRRHPSVEINGYGRIRGVQLRVAADIRGRSRRSVDIELHTTGFGSSARMELTRTDLVQAQQVSTLAVAN